MYITKISKIQNYRNLSGLSVFFDNQVNYIIGENNIGKTNLIELISKIFSLGKFSENDFYNICEPIEVNLTIGFSDDEIGFFEDFFDVDDSNEITISCVQASVDERIIYIHDTPCQIKIPTTIIKKINTLYYYAQRMPSKEIDFRKTSGAGKILNYLIRHNLNKTGYSTDDIITTANLSTVVDNINTQINSLNIVTGDNISAYQDIDTGKLISRLLLLGDENKREINELGEGIQYSFNILLQIIENIYSVKSSRKAEDFQNRLICVRDKKYFPLFLILDEPEIHQHPYRQRSLIKKLNGIMNNEIDEFVSLLNNLFEIDGLIGQLFVVTHSPNILSNNYKQFIRVYKEIDKLKIISGSKLSINGNDTFKHMLHNFIYLKEAMFSRGIIFVEGDTENGAIPELAQRLEFDLDSNGVGVVKLDGADSVLKCLDLYTQFGIKAFAILDHDKYDSYNKYQNIYFTNGKDFEEEIYDCFSFKDYLCCCRELEQVKQFIGILKSKKIVFNPKDFIEKIDELEIDENIAKEIMKEQKESELSKLRGSKNAAKGIILARYVTEIPKAYSCVIEVFNKRG